MGLFNKKQSRDELFQELLKSARNAVQQREDDVKDREIALRLKERDFEEHKNTVLLEMINQHGWKVEIDHKVGDKSYYY